MITTAIEETWPKDPDVPVLFLGEWCRTYSNKDRWSKMDAVVVHYHWDDRKKLYNDYHYLNNIYEIILMAMKEQLNEIHGVDYSLRYWRILIGPWLGYFIQILFDRWTMLKHAFEKHDISDCRIIKNNDNNFISKDMYEFNCLYLDDNWNELIYSQLLQEYWQDNIILEPVMLNIDQPQKSYQANGLIKSGLGRLKKSIVGMCMNYKQWFHDSNEYFFLKTYLPPFIEEKLLFKLGQNPKSWKLASVPMAKVDVKMREWTIHRHDSFDQFSTILSRMISSHIPVAYLEGFQSLLDCIRNLSWPKRPKCIFTSNAHYIDDVFKAWAADKTEHGVPLVIGQHGGHLGTGLWSFAEEHEIAISDRYLSWGWSDPDQPKVHPVGQIKKIGPLGINHAEQSGLLLVTATLPRYSYYMYSVPVSSQWLDYLEDQFTFIENLNPLIHNDMLVRLHVNDYGWEQEKRWSDRFPNIALDSGKKNINELIAKSRLFVSTYNAATYLESFTMDVPTVAFWNPKHWEIRASAVPYFDGLKRVGILHETPESAAFHISDVWDDIDAWWKSKPVRDALDQFKIRYCNSCGDLTSNIETELRVESNKY